MRDEIIAVKYSDNKEYRYVVYDRNDGTYEVWVEQRITDEYMGPDWFDYHDISDYMHLTDSVERAQAIGEELLRNMI